MFTLVLVPGRVYYHNRETMTTQWDKPGAVPVVPSVVAVTASAAVHSTVNSGARASATASAPSTSTSTSSSTVTPAVATASRSGGGNGALSWSSLHGALTSLAISETGAVVSQEPAVAANEWRQIFDANSQRYYYYNRVTRQSVWTLPPAATLAPTSPDPGGGAGGFFPAASLPSTTLPITSTSGGGGAAAVASSAGSGSGSLVTSRSESGHSSPGLPMGSGGGGAALAALPCAPLLHTSGPPSGYGSGASSVDGTACTVLCARVVGVC